MMIDTAIYLSGVWSAQNPGSGISVTEVEDVIRFAFEQLSRDPGQLLLLSRADGQDFAGTETFTVRVDNLDDWRYANEEAKFEDQPTEFRITRYVPIGERIRCIDPATVVDTSAQEALGL